MRGWMIAMAAVLLAGCGGNDVPSPNERLSGEQGDSAAFSETVALRGDGLNAGSESFFFAAGQSEVEAALSRQLGAATDSVQMLECGAGKLTATRFPGGLTVNFEQGRLVGWFIEQATDTITAPEGLTVGASRESAEEALGFAPFEGSTLGEEFSYGDGLGGIIEGDAVALLYAGKQCFFR